MMNYSQYKTPAGAARFPQYLSAAGGYPSGGYPQGGYGAGGSPLMVSPAGTQTSPPPVPAGYAMTPAGQTQPSGLTQEQSYIENIFRMNLGKTGTVYMTFENNREWNAKVFKGRVEAAGRDHLILSDPATGTRYLLPFVNFDYATFDEPLNYAYPYGGGRT